MESTGKVRRFFTNKASKAIVFILCAALAAAAWTQIIIMSYQGINPECLIIKQYKDSNSFISRYVSDAYNDAYQTLHEGGKMPESSSYYYYISNGKQTYTNVSSTNKAFFAQYDSAFYSYEKGLLTFGANTNSNISFGFANKDTVYIAFSDKFLETHQKTWQAQRDLLMPYAMGVVVCLLLSTVFFIWIICAAGKKPGDKELHLCRIDKMYSDILIAVLIGLTVGAFSIAFASNMYYYGNIVPGNMNTYEKYAFVLLGVCTFAMFMLCLAVFLSMVRKIKARKLLKHSLIYTICYKIYDFFRSLFDGRKFNKYPLTKSLFYRQMLFIVLSFVLVILTLALVRTPIFIVPFLLEAVLIYWFIKGSRKTYDDINKGFNESLEDQMRAERMKIALVTNVSHDLKTPLTSIISYVDLISKEEGLTDTVRDYVSILAEKSNRLKQIVSDLFELAKSTSGDIEINLEKIDFKKLIQQTLGDMDDKIQASNLRFKVKMPDESVNILSDGKKLYRVFLNVIDNALKYSHPGTRVFVSLEVIDKEAVATVVNTAGYEMDFCEEEILQRFNRGDKARTTEGSGLGLSIAESFTSVCGGKFNIKIDGDQFRVIIKFAKI